MSATRPKSPPPMPAPKRAVPPPPPPAARGQAIAPVVAEIMPAKKAPPPVPALARAATPANPFFPPSPADVRPPAPTPAKPFFPPSPADVRAPAPTPAKPFFPPSPADDRARATRATPPPFRKPGPPPIPASPASEPPPGDPRAREADDLVQAARTGDPRAFEALVKRYRHRIFALALHMTGSESDADDITQDAFLRAYRNLDRFEGRSEFFTWLYRIALNRALNVRRDRSRRRTQDIDDPRVVVAIAIDAQGDPQLAMELREGYRYLVRAFDKLSPVLQTTVTLVTMQGLSHSEAAVVLDSTEGTISWRIHEARKQLRAALDAMLKDPTPLRRPDFARAQKPAALASSAPSLEMALALLAPSV